MGDFSEVIAEIADSNPSLSENEVAAIFMRELKSSLPQAIKAMRPDPVKSPVQLKRLRTKFRRMRLIHREKRAEIESRRDKFLREIAFLKSRLNGTANSDRILFELHDNQNNCQLDIFLGSESPSKHLKPTDLLSEGFDGSASKKIERREKFSPYSSFLKIKEEKSNPKIEFDSEVENEIITEDVVKSFVGNIETSIRKIMPKIQISNDFKLFFSTSIEYPTWKRLILKIKPANNDFDEFIDIWEQLDSFVRLKIKEKAETLDEERKTKFASLSKELYIQADLK